VKKAETKTRRVIFGDVTFYYVVYTNVMEW